MCFYGGAFPQDLARSSSRSRAQRLSGDFLPKLVLGVKRARRRRLLSVSFECDSLSVELENREKSSEGG